MSDAAQDLRFKGRVWVAGDNVDTDMILPGRFLYATNKAALREHVFEGLDRSLAMKLQPGDIFVAGKNFGCGSARPAAAVMRSAGISCIVASSFSRTFLRSAIDTGVPILECDLSGRVREGDQILVNVADATVVTADGFVVVGKPFPRFILDIFAVGGIIPYTRQQLQDAASAT